MHEVLVNSLGGLSLPRKSVVRLTDRPDMTLDVYCGRKTTIQPIAHKKANIIYNFGQSECRDANLPDFCRIIPTVKSNFRITISDIKIPASNNFKMVVDEIKEVASPCT